MDGANLAGERLQLQYRGGSVHVDADKHDLLLVPLDQALRELGGRRGLTRALQAGEHYNHGRLCA